MISWMLAFNAASISNQEAAMMCQMRGMIGSVDSSTAGTSAAYALVADTLGADTFGARKSAAGSWSHQYVKKPLSMSAS